MTNQKILVNYVVPGALTMRMLKPHGFYLGILAFVGLTWAIMNTMLPFVLKTVILLE